MKRCDIAGPFENWHPHLRLVDLPGTLTTRIRTARRSPTALARKQEPSPFAQVTATSALISSRGCRTRQYSATWQATESRRQRLLILRTKFDSFHPEIDDELVDEADDTFEDRLFQEAIERHKHEQSNGSLPLPRCFGISLHPEFRLVSSDVGLGVSERKCSHGSMKFRYSLCLCLHTKCLPADTLLAERRRRTYPTISPTILRNRDPRPA